MGAAWAEGGSALHHILNDGESRAAGFGKATEFRAQSAIAQLRGNFFNRFDERDDLLGEDGVVQASGVGNSFSAAGEALAEKAVGDVGCGCMIKGMKRRITNIFLEEAAAFLDHDHLLAKPRELGHELGIGGIAHAHGEDRELAGQAQISQDMPQIGAGHAGDDETERGGIGNLRLAICS